MRNRLRTFTFTFLTALSLPLAAQSQQDTIKAEKAEVGGSAFVSAASDSRPREISLGLPTNPVGTVHIYEDDLPVSYHIFQLYPYKSWHGGVSAISSGSMNPMESAMRQNEIAYFVDGHDRIGSDKFRGSINYNVNQYGQHKVDLNISGPIARGWQYSLSTYQNFDRGSNHLLLAYLKDRHQFYKGALSKQFDNGRGNMALIYQYVNYMSIQENFGPFRFNNDGSVTPYGDFNLGHDSYYPEDKMFTLMDVKTGELYSQNLEDANRDKTHHVTFRLDYDLKNGNHLLVRSRFKTGLSNRANRTLSMLESVDESAGYTYEDGTLFSGDLQRRNILHFQAVETSWMSYAELSGKKNSHDWRLGADLRLNHGGATAASGALAHEAKADPKLLYRNGQAYYNYNAISEYYLGDEQKLSVYGKDAWKVSDRLNLEGFLRLEYHRIDAESAMNLDGSTVNTRRSGYNLKEGKITPFKEDFLNGALGLSGIYKLTKGLNLTAELVATRQHTNMQNYSSSFLPTTKPSDTKLIRAGISYKNDWLSLVSQMVYITQNNKNARSNFQHTLVRPVGENPAGYTQTLPQFAVYGISSMGWTTDAILTPLKGLNVHLLFTLRDPQYRNYEFSPTFSDGVTEHYDFSGNNVTNLHKVEIMIDPSYSFGPWRVWLQARYISKQYINKTNSLYFKGRWETFGGLDYQLNKQVKLSMNIINILNQKGASGVISSADLVEDASSYTNFAMAGTFIRPFTVEMGVKIDF